jgi:membrane-bound ClpP family serine protease
MRHWRFIAVVGIFFSVAVNAAQVGLIKIDGAIGPATASYIARAVDAAT